jgi:transcriptional regulator with XRE-family HTH domain
MTIGQRLKRMRQKASLSVSRLAELSGVQDNRIYLYERGAQVPTLQSLMRLAAPLGADLSAFADCETRADRRNRPVTHS